MNKNKIFLAFLILISGCQVANTVSSSSTPSNNNVNPSVSMSNSPIPSNITPSSKVSTTATPSPIVSTYPYKLPETGLINLDFGFIRTPESAFLVNNTFELKTLLSFNKLPEKDTFMTIFELFDNGDKNKKTHFSLTLDFDKNLILRAENTKGIINNVIPFKFVQENQAYEILFLRSLDKIEITINGEKIYSVDFKESDFPDLEGKRSLIFGATVQETNKISAKVDYIDIKDVLKYDFNNNSNDSGKYNINATLSSDQTIKYINQNIQPTAVPTFIPSNSPTPSVSSIPSISPERNVKDTSGDKIQDLGVYNSQNIDQYNECLRIGEERKKIDKNFTYDCFNESGGYTTPGFDLATNSFLNSELGDLRFITDVTTDINGVNMNRIVIAGSNIDPKVNIIDLGLKSYEGIDLLFLKDKVNYDKPLRDFSASNISSPVVIDHVYAIKTYRYGKEPRYAKILIKDIITDDYQFLRLNVPILVSAPQYVSFSGTSQFSPSKNYTYYLSTFDGFGETGANMVGTVNADINSTTSQVKLKIRVPYGAKGYSLFRKDESTGQIYKIGPILSAVDEDIDIFDDGNSGILIDSLPSSNNTIKSGFKPSRNAKPIKVNFKYYFDGDNNLSF